MNKERILNKIRVIIREQVAAAPTVNTGSTPSAAGNSSKADAKGPTAGYDKKMGKVRKRYIYGGHGSRKNWLPDRQVPKNILGQ